MAEQATKLARSDSCVSTTRIGLASIAVSLLFCFFSTLPSLVDVWWHNDFYSYCFLIPVISGYILWDRRDKLAHETVTSSYKYGIPLLAVGLSMLVVGDAGEISTIRWFSLIVSIFGTVLFCFGTGPLRIVWFPISYLIFMIPVWGGSNEQIHYSFQLLSAWIAEKILQSSGFLVFRTDGVILNLPDITLKVANECSGVRYLIAVAAIGLPVGYLFLRSWFNRILLVLTSLIIAIVGNGIRVALIGAWALHGASPDEIHGPGHTLRGLFVSFVGYCAIFVVLQILLKFESRTAIPEGAPRSPPPAGEPPSASSRRSRWVPLAVAFVLIGCYVNFYQPSPVPLKKDFTEFPLTIGQWKGSTAPPDFPIYGELGAHDELSRLYRSNSGEEVKLYVAYFRSQGAASGLRNYKAERLLKEARPFQLDLNSHGLLQVGKIVRGTDSKKKLVLTWYNINGHIVTDSRFARIQMISSTLFHGRRNGAALIVSCDFANDDDEAAAVRLCEDFLGDALPMLGEHLP
jgi:EpsI family protein